MERTVVEVEAASPHRGAKIAMAALALCCLCWGVSFPLAQRCTSLVEALLGEGTSSWQMLALRPTFNGWRFAMAALVYLLLTLGQQRGYNRSEVRGGAVIGLFFSGGVLLQLVGLRYTVPSVSAFLTSLAVVFAPLVQACFLRRAVTGRLWISIVLALGGTLLLSLPSTAGAGSLVQTPPVPYLGEILTTAGSLFFTAQILALDHYGQAANPVRLTFIMFAVAGVLGLAAGAAMGGTELYSGRVVGMLAGSGTFGWTFLCLVLVSCVLAMHLMNRYQPLVSPAVATVIYCLEPVFGTAFSVAMGTESLAAGTLGGGAIIIAAVLLIAMRVPEASALAGVARGD